MFALLTEVLQLYFNRNERFYDVDVDKIGMLAGYLMCQYFYTNDTIKNNFAKIIAKPLNITYDNKNVIKCNVFVT